MWNELAAELDLRPVQRLTANRRSALAARLAECGGLDGWRAALAQIRASPFLHGQNDTGWLVLAPIGGGHVLEIAITKQDAAQLVARLCEFVWPGCRLRSAQAAGQA